jgi:hypothetical protein
MKGKPYTATGSHQPSRISKRRKRNRRWECLLNSYEAGDFQIVPLTTSDDLRVDGYEMNHCVGRYYPSWCKQGFIRIFSIRNLLGQRLATVSLIFNYKQDRWRLEQCQGFDNSKVCFKANEPSDLHFLVEDIVRLYQQAHENAGHCRP